MALKVQTALFCLAFAALAAAKPAVPAKVQQPPAAKDICVHYARWGPAAVKGCQVCQKTMPKRVPTCMMCGTTCKKKHCHGVSDAACPRQQAFRTCYAKCAVTPAALAAKPAAPATKPPAAPKDCSKYAAWSPGAIKGCQTCHKTMPLKVDTCMNCGKKCLQQVCHGKGEACGKSPAFLACHEKCSKQPSPLQVKQAKAKQAKVKAFEAACGKYLKWSKVAVAGCGHCLAGHPGKVDACMDCGRMCLASACRSQPHKQCAASAAYKHCHKGCMAKVGTKMLVV